jgi:cytochrome c oxidase cbb3-type subunit 3
LILGKALRFGPVLRSPRLLVVFLLAVAACEQPPSADSLKEWTPGDHHSSDDDRGQAPGQVASGAPRGGDTAQLVEITWRQQCSGCHGAMGKGDGQLGPMVQAPDLTRDDWQAKVSDAEIAATIKSGKNKMPKFDSLPDPVVAGLVGRIRAARGH